VTTAGPVLLCDATPWYHFDTAGLPMLWRSVGQPYRTFLDPEGVDRATAFLVAALHAGDVVLLPSMGAVLMRDAMEQWASGNGGEVFPLPSSRHPYVTLSLDPPDLLNETCRDYATSAPALMAELPEMLRRCISEGRRVVFIDVNSATGRDAVLVDRWLQEIAGQPVDFAFMVLIEELSTATAVGGYRGTRIRLPDVSAVRLTSGSTRYLSHLAFLSRYGEEERFQIAKRVRDEHPILHFWNTRPAPLRAIHGYEDSPLRIHKERLHLRVSSAEEALEGDAGTVWRHIEDWTSTVNLRPRSRTDRLRYFTHHRATDPAAAPVDA
jgi:hypothetical protein